MIRGKSGKKAWNEVTFAAIFWIVLSIFLLSSTLITIDKLSSENQEVGEAIVSGISRSVELFGEVLDPLLGGLLGTADNGENKFIMMITFILLLVVITQALDSINIFGDTDKGSTIIINFVVGIIVSVIGVRFMPADYWDQLTAPSSAFAAVLLLGLPFGALFFVTKKIKSDMVQRIIWVIYILIIGSIIIPGEVSAQTKFLWIYIIFIILAVAMMLGLNSWITKLLNKERAKNEIQNTLHEESVLDRKQLRDKAKELRAILNDPDTTQDERDIAEKKLYTINKRYAETAE